MFGIIKSGNYDRERRKRERRETRSQTEPVPATPDQMTTVAKTPEPPPPNLATKPEDIVGHCFAFVCPKKHVQETFEKITVDEFKQRRACKKCGGLAKPAVVKSRAEAIWGVDGWPLMCWNREVMYGWRQIWQSGGTRWNHFEFVRFLQPERKTK